MNWRAEFTLKGFFYKILERLFVLRLLMITSYVPSLPESKNLLSVRRNTRTTMSCHTCEINEEDLASFKKNQKWCWSKTKASFEGNQNSMEGEWEQSRVLEETSMHSVRPIVVRIPFGKFHPSVDIYAIFCFKSLQNLSLGVDQLQNKWWRSMLSNKLREALALRAGFQTCKTSQADKITALSTIDRFWLNLNIDSWVLVLEFSNILEHYKTGVNERT